MIYALSAILWAVTFTAHVKGHASFRNVLMVGGVVLTFAIKGLAGVLTFFCIGSIIGFVLAVGAGLYLRRPLRPK